MISASNEVAISISVGKHTAFCEDEQAAGQAGHGAGEDEGHPLDQLNVHADGFRAQRRISGPTKGVRWAKPPS